MRYFGVSVDTVDANTRFAQSLGLDYPILSDPAKDVAKTYGVLSPAGLASRWTFYIGLDGRILQVDRKVNAGSHGSEVAETLDRLAVPRTNPEP